MLTDDELAAMRDTTTAALPDTCTITRAAAATPTFDADTGLYGAIGTTVVHAGPCRLRPSAGASAAEHGDDQVTVDTWTLTIAATAAAIAVGDIVTVTGASDPTLASRKFRVLELPAGSWLITQHVTVEEVVDG